MSSRPAADQTAPAKARWRCAATGTAANRWGFVASLMLGLVVRVPGALGQGGLAPQFYEPFAVNPAERGWRVAGDSSLFRWNPETQAVDVTWDSSRTNSFFYKTLPTTLTKADDFRLTFFLRLHDIRIGSTPGKPAEFPIAIGFAHRALFSSTNAYRGAGVSTLHGVRNVVEWNFFPDGGFGDTWATTVISSNNVFAFGHTFPLPLVPEDAYQIALSYTASNQTLVTTALQNGVQLGPFESVWLGGTPDFRLDAVTITSYSDAGQPGPEIYRGSVLAHGTIHELSVWMPPPPTESLSIQLASGRASAVFLARSNWVHTLERSANLQHWLPASGPLSGTGAFVSIRDTNALAPAAFYRVRSERP